MDLTYEQRLLLLSSRPGRLEAWHSAPGWLVNECVGLGLVERVGKTSAWRLTGACLAPKTESLYPGAYICGLFRLSLIACKSRTPFSSTRGTSAQSKNSRHAFGLEAAGRNNFETSRLAVPKISQSRG